MQYDTPLKVVPTSMPTTNLRLVPRYGPLTLADMVDERNSTGITGIDGWALTVGNSFVRFYTRR